MKAKTKLIATLMAMCLVITLGVFGILAVKTLNMSVGGNITFTADGIAFEVLDGAFKTTSGAEYTGITTQTDKLQDFEMNTNTKQSDVQSKIDSWKGLDLVATETLGDPVLYFKIKNNMTDDILSFNPTITLGTNINDNMRIKIEPAVANIQPTLSQEFEITFEIIDKTINAGLTGENYSGFAINILLSTAYVAEPSEMPQMTFAPTESDTNKYVISNCTSATGDVVIPSFVKVGNANYPVTEIADSAFANNHNITSLTIPNTVTRIGNSAFAYCSNLTGELVIPNSVTTIGNAAFLSCCGDLTSLVIGNGVTTIGDDAFECCCGFTGDLVIPDSVTTIGAYAFDMCAFTGQLIIPDSVTTIGDYAFSACCNLTKLTIGSGLTTIGEFTFKDCSSLSGELVIPNSVTTIGASAFECCDNLTSVVIGNGLTTIGGSAFLDCSSLESITIKATTPPSLDEGGGFEGTDCPIYVPSQSLFPYQNDTTKGWNVIEDNRIKAIPA